MGGKAFNLTRRIKREEIPLTLKWLSGYIPLSQEYLTNHLLGSSGKSPTSGDLDLNINYSKELFDEILSSLQRCLPADSIKSRPGNKQIFTQVPIEGNTENGFVQIDFMFGDEVWQEFSYASPGEKSSYKGLFRTELIKALCAFNSDWVLEENDQVIARVGPTFFHDRGVVWRYRYRPFRKDGKGRVKEFAETSEEIFLGLFPDSIRASHTCLTEPRNVAKFIFGSDDLQVFFSYETLSKKILENFSYEDQKVILDIYLERLNSLGVDIPQEIKDGFNCTKPTIGQYSL